RGDIDAPDHVRSRGEPGRGQLSFRQQGRPVRGGVDAAARSDEPGTPGIAYAARARIRIAATHPRENPRRDVYPGAAPGARSRARWQELPATARTRLCRPGAVHPPLPV